MFSTYIKYKHKFETKREKKIVAKNYGNVDLKITDLIGNVNILIVTNISRALELGYNSLNIILLARKNIEVYLKITDQPSKITIDKEVFGLANIIKN